MLEDSACAELEEAWPLGRAGPCGFRNSLCEGVAGGSMRGMGMKGMNTRCLMWVAQGPAHVAGCLCVCLSEGSTVGQQSEEEVAMEKSMSMSRWGGFEHSTTAAWIFLFFCHQTAHDFDCTARQILPSNRTRTALDPHRASLHGLSL